MKNHEKLMFAKSMYDHLGYVYDSLGCIRTDFQVSRTISDDFQNGAKHSPPGDRGVPD